MRTLLLSLIIGVLSGTSGAAVTSRVKIAEADPVEKSVCPSAEAHIAAPVEATVRPEIPAIHANAITSLAPMTSAASEDDRYKFLISDVKSVPSSESIATVAPPMRGATESSRVDTLYWYDWKLYDVGTALWAIASKAKWYAEKGDTAKVNALRSYFFSVLQDVEANGNEQERSER